MPLFFFRYFVYFFKTDKPYFTPDPFSWERERRQFRERPDIGTTGTLPAASPLTLRTATMAMAPLPVTQVGPSIPARLRPAKDGQPYPVQTMS